MKNGGKNKSVYNFAQCIYIYIILYLIPYTYLFLASFSINLTTIVNITDVLYFIIYLLGLVSLLNNTLQYIH